MIWNLWQQSSITIQHTWIKTYCIVTCSRFIRNYKNELYVILDLKTHIHSLIEPRPHNSLRGNATSFPFSRWESPIADNVQNSDSDPDLHHCHILYRYFENLEKERIDAGWEICIRFFRESRVWSLRWISTQRLSKAKGTKAQKKKSGR